MVNSNIALAGVDTDYAINTILGNFSDEFIIQTIKSSLEYRFRPYGLRSPNYPAILKYKFDVIKEHSTGYDQEIDEQENDTMEVIIETICNFYNLQVKEEIPDEYCYVLAYYLYQIFDSEFTERIINFFTNYIINNIDMLIQNLPMEGRNVKTSYAKKIYKDQNLMIIYDNMSKILDMLAGLDIPFNSLVYYLSDQRIADFISYYVEDIDDCYKTHFGIFLVDQTTKTDMLAAIRSQFVAATAQNTQLFNLETNPYVGNEPEEGEEPEVPDTTL